MVRIVGDSRRHGVEAVIERITLGGDCVGVRLLMADGSTAAARLARDEWDWLELRRGDIVPVALVSA